MQKEPQFEYRVQSTLRTRRLRITVRHNGIVIVSKPAHMPESVARAFVQKHSEWIASKLERFKKKPVPILAKLNKRDYAKHKEAARALVHERVRYWNSTYRFTVGSIRIGNQKSRWGSCSAKGNLNFNYKIIFLPKELQDYVVVHELCHLQELNHSSQFWSLVERVIPDWKKQRLLLKKW